MNEDWIPNKIFSEYINNNINKTGAIELLISYLEGYQDIKQYIEALEILGRIGRNSPKSFRIIENNLVSNETSLVRNIAAKLLFHNFPKKMNFIPLKWLSIHESSVVVLKTLIDLFSSVNDPHFKILYETIMKRLKKIYSINSNQVLIFLNLEKIYVDYSKDYEYKINSGWFKIMQMLNKYSHLKDLIQYIYYLRLGGQKQDIKEYYSIIYLHDLIFKRSYT